LLEAPEVSAQEIHGTVITIDHFGNLITNIDAAMLAGLEQPRVYTGGRELPLQETYGRSRPGDFLALVNSFDVVEIARAEGSAADGLGLGRGAPVIVRGRS
jgi:S-adenosylmethionine hydrolase